MSRTRTFGHRRSRIALAVLGTLALGAALLASNAEANLTGSTFEGNDGNLVVNTPGNTDWANATGVNTGIDKPSGGSDNAFGQGAKEDSTTPTVVAGSIPPNKNDLTRFYEASSQGSNGHTYLELAWERATNIGNANLDFEINQNPTAGFTSSSTGTVTLNRTAGDLLVTYDFGGSGAPTLGLNTWVTSGPASQCFASSSLPCWGNHVNLGGSAEGAVNTVPVLDPLQAGSPTLGAGLFGEASIDLTAANIFPTGTCEAFGSTFVKSRSSTSFTAELKDFIAPVGVTISNCSTITIHKVTQNGDSTFGYTTTGSLTPSTFSLSNGGQQAYSGVPQGSYSVTENLTTAQVTAGWTLSSLTCTKSGSGTTTTVSGSTVSITTGPSGTVDCTYTNHINLSPTISTSLSATTASIGDSITDSATLTGATTNAGGTVTYHAYAGANTCSGTDLLNDPVNHTNTVTVTSGVVPNSPAFVPTAAGNYSFQAVYSGDSNNNTATSTCSDEQLLVKTNPGIGTTLSGTSVAVGSTVHDSAALSGKTSDAGGTVTYTVYSDSGCSTGARDAGTVNVSNGTVPDSNGLQFNTAGSYYWQAVYSGDTKNNGATSTCTDELLTVNPLQPGGSTAQNVIPNDSFTLTGATSGAGGNVVFKLFAPTDSTCSGTPALSQTVGVSGNATYSTTNTTFVASTQGTWRWLVVYGGDTNNDSVTSTCGTEQFTITNS